MKSIILFVLVLLFNSVSAKQVINIGGSGTQTVSSGNSGIANGEAVPDIKLTNLLNMYI